MLGWAKTARFSTSQELNVSNILRHCFFPFTKER